VVEHEEAPAGPHAPSAQVVHLLQPGELLGIVDVSGPALFGDDEHCVTVRAEMSRLRRAVGGLVTTNPYRLTDGVVLTVVRRDATASDGHARRR
jgi:hypothetical protein